ncbi:MAG: hypothetical protein ACOX6T_13835 [Myxococcales bacterium]|jgi:hypothetical protein
MRSSQSVAGAVVILLLLADPASATDGKPESPWAGTALTYKPGLAAASEVSSKEQEWSVYAAHVLSLQPRWTPLELLRVAARLDLDQGMRDFGDLERFDWTWSDLSLDVGTGDRVTELFSGLRITGGVRVNLPLSEASRRRSMRLSAGPSAELSRTFPVLDGLTLAYRGRWTYQFNRWKQASDGRFLPPPQVGCGDPHDPGCQPFVESGARNTQHVLQHGPSLFLAFSDALSLSLALGFQTQWLEPYGATTVTDGTGQPVEVEAGPSASVLRSRWLAGELQTREADPVSIALGVCLWDRDVQLGTKKVVERYADVYLSLSLDIDSAVRGL